MGRGFTHESTALDIPVEWYTPPSIFQSLGLVFDLDPCSPGAERTNVPARVHWSLPTDGLAEPWFGNVWCNPPYGRETGRWMHRLAEHGTGIALVYARTDTRWFQQTVAQADAVLFIAGRVRFINGATGQQGGGASAGSMLVAYGSANAHVLARSNLGICVNPAQQ
jgi:phage N-6-adenine-methyltransferase